MTCLVLSLALSQFDLCDTFLPDYDISEFAESEEPEDTTPEQTAETEEDSQEQPTQSVPDGEGLDFPLPDMTESETDKQLLIDQQQADTMLSMVKELTKQTTSSEMVSLCTRSLTRLGKNLIVSFCLWTGGRKFFAWHTTRD